jgi:hypothetical protein
MRVIDQFLESFRAVAKHGDLKTFPGEIFGEHLAQLTIVVDNQQRGWLRH